MNKGNLIGGFKAIGKTTIADKYENVIDLESSDYEYYFNDNIKNISKEERKGRTDRIKNPEYPMNYINAMIKLKNEGKIVLFACKKEIIDILNELNEEYLIVYPKEEMLDEIIERCKKRGNIEEFINKIRKVYERDYPQGEDKVIWLKNNQFIEEILLEKGIIRK